jgi:hypothetical protein
MSLGNPTKGATMTKRIQKGFVAVLALAALAVGGSAVASAATNSPATTPPAAEQVGGPDHDTIQSGDQTTPDVGTAAATASKSTAPSAAGEQPGAESSEAPGAETAPGNDGPGGHADEPGNPQANNQFQGQQ